MKKHISVNVTVTLKISVDESLIGEELNEVIENTITEMDYDFVSHNKLAVIKNTEIQEHELLID